MIYLAQYQTSWLQQVASGLRDVADFRSETAAHFGVPADAVVVVEREGTVRDAERLVGELASGTFESRPVIFAPAPPPPLPGPKAVLRQRVQQATTVVELRDILMDLLAL